MHSTATSGLLNPSAFPSAPQWIGMDSGNLSHTISPNSMGKRINIEEMISFHLFRFSIIIISFQLRNP